MTNKKKIVEKKEGANGKGDANQEFSVLEYSSRLFGYVEHVDEAYFLVDANSRNILRANSAASRLTGFSPSELQSLKIDKLHPSEELPLLLLEIQRLEFEQRTFIEEFTLIQKNGWKFPVDIQLLRLVQEEEEFIHRYFIAIYKGEVKADWNTSHSRQNERLVALMEVGQTIASALDVEEIIDLTMLKLASVCGARYVSLFLKDSTGQLRMYKAHKNPPEDVQLFDQPWRVGIEEGPYDLVDEHQKILSIDNVFTDERFTRWQPIAERIGYRSMISLAMVPRDVSIGVFSLYYDQAKKFTQEEINFLRTAVTYLAISIENARLYREHKEKADQLQVINEITNSINSSLDLEEVIKTVSVEVKRIVDFDYISIVLFEEGSDKLHVYSLASKALAEKLGDVRWRQIEGAPVGWLELGPAQSVSAKLGKEMHDVLYEYKLIIEKELKSRLNVLLLSKDKYLGTVSIGKLEPGAFNPTHQEIFRQIAGQVATALENARLYQDARRRLTEFSALADVSQTISSSLNIREVLDLIVKAAATAMRAKICTIWFVGEKNGLGKYSSNGVDDSPIQQNIWKRMDVVIRKMQPLIIEDLEQEGMEAEELPESLKRTRLRSYLGVPVISRNKTIAVLSVYKEKPYHFDDREIKLLRTIANQAAIGIENARLYERERRRAAQLAMVNEIGKKVTRTLDLQELLTTITSAIQEIFGYSHVAIYLTDQETGKTVLKSHTGALKDQLRVGQVLNNPKTPIMRSILNGETEVILDLEKEKHLDRGYARSGSLLSIPLQVADRVSGSLVLLSHRKYGFDRRDLYAFEALATQIASAIENARLFEETKQKSQELEQANSELESFVFTVSHDLKAPLVSVQGFASILLDDFAKDLKDEALHYLERIISNVTQMERLIHDLLELSRIGRVKESPEINDMKEIVETSVQDLLFQAKKKNVKIEYSETFPRVFCDKNRMIQVFTNLIGNAIKYMGENPDPRIQIGCQEREKEYVFYVRDNGIGIDPAYHEKIFELFHSLKEIKDEEGTGVGLTIVKRIVENHKGKIWVESEKGKGSTFYFSLPKSQIGYAERRKT